MSLATDEPPAAFAISSASQPGALFGSALSLHAVHCSFMLSILWTINHYHPHHHHYIMVIIIIIIIIGIIIIIIIRVVLSCVMVLLVLVCSPGVLVSGRKRRNQ